MSSLVLTIHNFGVPNFDPYPYKKLWKPNGLIKKIIYDWWVFHMKNVNVCRRVVRNAVCKTCKGCSRVHHALDTTIQDKVACSKARPIEKAEKASANAEFSRFHIHIPI